MTLTSDHMAWQQRVSKETNITSKLMDYEQRSVASYGKYSESFREKIMIGVEKKNLEYYNLSC
jgi:hypothetical protein